MSCYFVNIITSYLENWSVSINVHWSIWNKSSKAVIFTSIDVCRDKDKETDKDQETHIVVSQVQVLQLFFHIIIWIVNVISKCMQRPPAAENVLTPSDHWRWVEGWGPHWWAVAVTGNVYSTFQLCAYLWVQHTQVASSMNKCVDCVGGLKKGLEVQTAYHICFSQRHTMTSLAFVSILIVTIMVPSASAQGKENRNYLCICIFFVFVLFKICLSSCETVAMTLMVIMEFCVFFKGGIGNCCLRVTNTQVSRDLLKGYYVQHSSSCRLHVVV